MEVVLQNRNHLNRITVGIQKDKADENTRFFSFIVLIISKLKGVKDFINKLNYQSLFHL